MDRIHMDHGFSMPPGLRGPPIMNTPPQIFGAYAPEGMPIPHLPPDLAAQMFPDPSTLLDDSSEAKRRRIARVRHFTSFQSNLDAKLNWILSLGM